MHWKDLRAGDERWLGLELSVERRPTPPVWRVEVTSPRCLRLCCGDTPLLWVRLEPGWSGFWWLSAQAGAAQGLEPLRAREVDALSASPGSEGWYAAWARHFAQALALSPRSPLHEGSWWLLRGFAQTSPSERANPPVSPWAVAHDVGGYAAQPLAGHARWGAFPTHPLLGLKPPSALSPSRLKVWRKRARDGTLPPLLALFVSSLDGPVVLDGHHRWMAALEEARPLPLLMLWPSRVWTYPARDSSREVVERLYQAQGSGRGESRPIRVDTLNALAMDAWVVQSDATPHTRAWPLPGRFDRWASEVHERLDTLGTGVAPEVREALLAAPGG